MSGSPFPDRQQTDDSWDMIIKPYGGFFEIDLKEIWRYRDLLMLFVKRDFSAQYKQTVLGPLWHIIQPILTTAIFLLLFGKIANIPTDGIQPVLFYMSGITLWNYFSSCLTNTSSTFTANASIFGKVYFPRLIIPLSIILSNIARLGIQFGLLMVTMIWYQFHGFPIHITIFWLWIPVLIILLAGTALGLGIIVSSITSKYRDFAVLLAFAVQLLMYISPIGYPLSYLGHSKYKDIISINPLCGIIETFRFALFEKGEMNIHLLLYSFAFMTIVLFIGLTVFSKVQKTFMDTV
jgi:lipopolysaccharide transport system permease protein